MERYKLADPIIKDKCRTDEWSNAMIYLIFESYQDKPIDILKDVDDRRNGKHPCPNALTSVIS